MVKMAIFYKFIEQVISFQDKTASSSKAAAKKRSIINKKIIEITSENMSTGILFIAIFNLLPNGQIHFEKA